MPKQFEPPRSIADTLKEEQGTYHAGPQTASKPYAKANTQAHTKPQTKTQEQVRLEKEARLKQDKPARETPKRQTNPKRKPGRPVEEKANKQVVSFTLEPEQIKALKQEAYTRSSPEKTVSASQVLNDILQGYFEKEG